RSPTRSVGLHLIRNRLLDLTMSSGPIARSRSLGPGGRPRRVLFLCRAGSCAPAPHLVLRPVARRGTPWLGGSVGAIEILNPHMLERMRQSCALAAETLCMVGEHLREGMTTDEINVLVHEYIVSREAYPSPLNYRGFPKSVCTSVNEVVCHGIPGKQTLKHGDIIDVDVTTYLPAKNGFHGDTSATFYIGEP